MKKQVYIPPCSEVVTMRTEGVLCTSTLVILYDSFLIDSGFDSYTIETADVTWQ